MLVTATTTSISAMYIDPAALSYVTLAVAGVLTTAGVLIKVYWSKISRKFKKQPAEGDENVELINEGAEKIAEKSVITAADLLDEEEN